MKALIDAWADAARRHGLRVILAHRSFFRASPWRSCRFWRYQAPASTFVSSIH